MVLCVAHTDVFTSKYYIIQWISTNGNSTQHEVANKLFAKGSLSTLAEVVWWTYHITFCMCDSSTHK